MIKKLALCILLACTMHASQAPQGKALQKGLVESPKTTDIKNQKEVAPTLPPQQAAAAAQAVANKKKKPALKRFKNTVITPIIVPRG